jgi:pilus assembly protein Flp/PilA
MEKLIRFFKDEEGATAVEYGIMVALIAIAIIATVYTLGGQLNTTFKSASDKMASPT